MFDWSDIRIFLAVHARGSFTAAAAELRMDQTTVGRRIAALETTLNARLFRRGRDGLALTDAGQDALASAKRMQEAAFQLDREIRAHDHAPAGSVRISTVETFAARFLAPRLSTLRDAFPDVTVELSTGNQNSDLTRREADIAIRLGKPRQPGVVARKMGVIGYGLYGSKAYVARHGKSVTDLAHHLVLGFDEDLSSIPEAQWLAARGVASIILRSNTVSVLENATVAGLGIAVLPCYIADKHEALVRLLGPNEVVKREIWVLVHSELQRQARIRVVIEHVVRETTRCASLLAG